MTTLAEAARRYAAQGWHVFPLAPCAKEPLHAGPGGFRRASSDATTVAAWWREAPDANIGLWPGPSGLVIIDIDGPEGAQAAMRLGVHVAPTASVTTGRADGGRHLYYLHPGYRVGSRPLAPHLDVRGDLGYVVAPPSVHPSGAVYAWGRDRHIAALPPIVDEMLHAWTTPQPAAPPPIPPAPAQGDSLDARVTAYLHAVGSAAEGARNRTAYWLAAWLTRDMALSHADAWSYLMSWNAGCAPPLPERELARVLSSAIRHARAHAVGSGLARERRIGAGDTQYGRRYGKRYGAGYGTRR